MDESEFVYGDKLTRAEVLTALFNVSKPQGMGFLQPHSAQMRLEEAERLLEITSSFDYVRGRVMKISLHRDGVVDTRLFDRDVGPGAGRRALEEAINKKINQKSG